jgi:hypothetical protein
VIAGEPGQIVDEREIGIRDERAPDVFVVVCQPGLHG